MRWVPEAVPYVALEFEMWLTEPTVIVHCVQKFHFFAFLENDANNVFVLNFFQLHIACYLVFSL